MNVGQACGQVQVLKNEAASTLSCICVRWKREEAVMEAHLAVVLVH